MAFGLADVTIGNGFIAAFVAGIVMGRAEHEIPDAFVVFSENVSAILQVITFFVFGALIVATGYDGEIWRLALFIVFTLVVARPLAIAIAFLRERLPGPQKAFIAWFGPKGVATMAFSLLVLSRQIEAGQRIFNIAALAVFASILLHGLTDTPGTNWMARRSARGEATI
jgi:NhaP-type Na+/H+ and K+/H+ antiporter